jgi:AbrB family looped-hinge helix DNA binding protein
LKSKEVWFKVRIMKATVRKQAKITSKGQITLPLEVRCALGVGAGDRLAFEGDENGMHLRPVRAESPFAKYRGIGNHGIGSGRKAIARWLRELRGR